MGGRTPALAARWVTRPHLLDTFSSTSREVNEARGGLILAAGRVRSKKKNRKKKTRKNPPQPKHHEIHDSPATAITSRRLATKHVRRVSPYSPASIDPGFVEIGLIQLSQSVLVERKIKQGGLIYLEQAVSVRRKKNEKKKKHGKIRPTQNTPPKPQSPRPTRDGM